MTRLVSLALACVFSLLLLEPALRSSPSDSALPACCRGDGKHGCGMRKAAQAGSDAPALREHCRLWPAQPSVPSLLTSATPGQALVRLVEPIRDAVLAVVFRQPDLSSPSFDRSQRGPPVHS